MTSATQIALRARMRPSPERDDVQEPVEAFPADATGLVGVRVPGGLLDPSYTDRDVYLGTPQAAQTPLGCAFAEKYVQLINEQRFDEVVDLYSDNAVVIPPLANMRAEGRQEIAKFYETVVAGYLPNIIVVAYGVYGNECFQVHATAHLIGGVTRYVLSTVDHFTVNEAGLIVQMIAYHRPRQ